MQFIHCIDFYKFRGHALNSTDFVDKRHDFHKRRGQALKIFGIQKTTTTNKSFLRPRQRSFLVKKLGRVSQIKQSSAKFSIEPNCTIVVRSFKG